MLTNKDSLKLKFLFTLSVVFQFFTLWWHWPGIFSWDILNISYGLSQGHISSWYSFTYSYILLFFYNISPHPFLPIAFCILTQNILFYYFLNWLVRRNHLKIQYIYFFYSIFNFWPYFLINNLHLDRDLFSAILQATLLCYFLLRALNGKSLYKYGVIEISIIAALTVLAAEIRQDSILLLITVPAVLSVTSKVNLKEALSYICVCLAMSMYFFNYMSTHYSSPTEIHKYQATAFLNPLEEMIVEGYLEDLPPEEQEVIQNVFSNKIPQVKEAFSEAAINSLHKGFYNPDYANEHWQQFTRITFKLFLTHPITFLMNRGRMFIHHVGFYGYAEFYWDAFHSGDQEIKRMAKVYYNVNRSKRTADRVEMFNQFILSIQRINWLNSLFLSPAPAILLALLLALNWQVTPITCIGLAIIWLRFPILLLCAPASSGKYFHSLMLGTLICFVFSFAELRHRQKTLPS